MIQLTIICRDSNFVIEIQIISDCDSEISNLWTVQSIENFYLWTDEVNG